MLSSIDRGHFNPSSRGYHAVYRENEVNHCPGCGRTHWYLGRVLAECAFCSTALPLEATYRVGASSPAIMRRSSRTSYAELSVA